MISDDYKKLPEPIERSVRERGVSPDSVWLDRERGTEKMLARADATTRMIDDATAAFSLLDVGCGPGLSLAWLSQRFEARMARYCGVDLSTSLVEEARKRWPGHEFVRRDIIADPYPPEAFDFTIINGVLTAKFSLSHEAMEEFAMALLSSAWRSTKFALSFNVMSPHVDWTREDLFHWPMDRAAAFCTARLSRHLNILADYGLYEYTVQIFRQPRSFDRPVPPAWCTDEQG